MTALWVLLTCAGYMLFLVYAVRPAFIYFLRRSGALQDGPSQGVISFTLVLALGSAFFTGIIGVHPIFGAFMAGLICPHEGGFAIKVAEKIEDLIGALFLPLYFTLSGLNTNIGLLDSGIVWAYVIGVVVVAFFSKFISATLAARGTKMLWRECFAIGSLMSCKGLVELIVLVCMRVHCFAGDEELTNAEYRVECEDPEHTNIYHLRRYGSCHHVFVFSTYEFLLSSFVPEKGGSLASWGD